jgi:hypothetical protein
MAVFWDVATCSLVEIYQHFSGAYCLQHQGDVHLHTRRRESLKSHKAELLNIKAVCLVELVVITVF